MPAIELSTKSCSLPPENGRQEHSTNPGGMQRQQRRMQEKHLMRESQIVSRSLKTAVQRL